MDFLLSWVSATTKTSVHYLPSTAVSSWGPFHKQRTFTTSHPLTFQPAIRSGFVWILLRQKSRLQWLLTHPHATPSSGLIVSLELPIGQFCLVPFLVPLFSQGAAVSHSFQGQHSHCALWGCEWCLEPCNTMTLSGHHSDLSLLCSKRPSVLGFPADTNSLTDLLKILNEPTSQHHNFPKPDHSLQVFSETHHFQDLETLIPITLSCVFKLESCPKPYIQSGCLHL